MAETEKNINTDNAKQIISDLSFSCMMLYSEKQSLKDLDEAINELSTLVTYLETKNSK